MVVPLNPHLRRVITLLTLCIELPFDLIPLVPNINHSPAADQILSYDPHSSLKVDAGHNEIPLLNNAKRLSILLSILKWTTRHPPLVLNRHTLKLTVLAFDDHIQNENSALLVLVLTDIPEVSVNNTDRMRAFRNQWSFNRLNGLIKVEGKVRFLVEVVVILLVLRGIISLWRSVTHCLLAFLLCDWKDIGIGMLRILSHCLLDRWTNTRLWSIWRWRYWLVYLRLLQNLIRVLFCILLDVIHHLFFGPNQLTERWVL